MRRHLHAPVSVPGCHSELVGSDVEKTASSTSTLALAVADVHTCIVRSVPSRALPHEGRRDRLHATRQVPPALTQFTLTRTLIK
jgi:hypothetical protein